nr:uncharacterized protein LOC123750227 isoform X1 [Procambarus clarkii]
MIYLNATWNEFQPMYIMQCFPSQRLLSFLPTPVVALLAGVSGVKVHKVVVPRPGVVGRSAELQCQWDEDARGFYSVRWYKNADQFYSYVPKNEPQDKVDHRLAGVSVVLSRSDEYKVTLRELRLDSEGVYRCEVMTESPTFETSFASENLTVVVLPEAPQVEGLRESYTVGDTLNVTCTARDARPPATLAFHVNDRHVPAGTGAVAVSTTEGSYPGVYTTTARLLLPLGRHHIPAIALLCRSTVLSIADQTALTAQVHHQPILSFFNTGGSEASPHRVLLVVLLLFLAYFSHLPTCCSCCCCC